MYFKKNWTIVYVDENVLASWVRH